MSLAVLYDIHGNLPALESVMEQIPSDVEAIVFGGDIVPGPMPRECLDLLFSQGKPVHAIYGNCETMMLQMADGLEDEVPQGLHSVLGWAAENLTKNQVEQIRSWPKTVTFDIDGQKVLLCHGTPRDENEIFTIRTPETRAAEMFNGVEADLVVYGHTHMQIDTRVGQLRIVNAGSVGMPFGRTGADWLLLDGNVHFRHLDYDLNAAAERIRACDYPAKDAFIEEYVLSSPSQEVIFRQIDDQENAAVRANS